GGPISNLAALGIASTDVQGQFRGFLPTMFREIDFALDRKYVRELEKALVLFRGFEEGGQVAPLQVAQVESQLLNAQNAVLKDVQDMTNAMDQLKLQLGLPTNTPLLLDDSLARPITRQLDSYYDVIAKSDAAYKRVEQHVEVPPDQVRPLLAKLFSQDPLVQG